MSYGCRRPIFFKMETTCNIGDEWQIEIIGENKNKTVWFGKPLSLFKKAKVIPQKCEGILKFEKEFNVDAEYNEYSNSWWCSLFDKQWQLTPQDIDIDYAKAKKMSDIYNNVKQQVEGVKKWFDDRNVVYNMTEYGDSFHFESKFTDSITILKYIIPNEETRAYFTKDVYHTLNTSFAEIAEHNLKLQQFKDRFQKYEQRFEKHKLTWKVYVCDLKVMITGERYKEQIGDDTVYYKTHTIKVYTEEDLQKTLTEINDGKYQPEISESIKTKNIYHSDSGGLSYCHDFDE